MKLTLEHLCAYLPHGVYVQYSDLPEYGGKKKQAALTTFMLMHWRDMFDDMRPILRHPSCITKEIEHRGEKFVPMDKLDAHHNFSVMRYDDIQNDPTRYPYTIVQALLSWHIDVFGLIEGGLAIDVEALDVNPYAK